MADKTGVEVKPYDIVWRPLRIAEELLELLRMRKLRRVGAKAAGERLDGKQWHQFPEVR